MRAGLRSENYFWLKIVQMYKIPQNINREKFHYLENSEIEITSC